MTDIISKAAVGVAGKTSRLRARTGRAKNSCSACNTRLPDGEARGNKRTALCDGCFTRAIRVVLRPCRN